MRSTTSVIPLSVARSSDCTEPTTSWPPGQSWLSSTTQSSCTSVLRSWSTCSRLVSPFPTSSSRSPPVFSLFDAPFLSGVDPVPALGGRHQRLCHLWPPVTSNILTSATCTVFGKSYADIPNHIPASVGFTTKQMLAFFLYWLCHVPFTFFRPYQLRWVFTVKMFTVVPACIGLFIFCMVNTKGRIGGGLPNSAAASASSFSWFIMYAINSVIGNFVRQDLKPSSPSKTRLLTFTQANLITNAPDFSRYSKYKYASVWPQVLANPISITISATFGILSTSAINNAWGLELWNPWDLLDAIMTRYPTSGVRFAIFLCASFWALLVLGTNIVANMIP